MKYIVIIGDGMADRPLEELGGLTPLQKAYTPNMDALAKNGLAGKVKTIPDGFQPGSDVANLCILGYDPAQYYSGRAPLEAASMGVELLDNDVAYRCNIVTIKEDGDWDRFIMADYSAGHITSKEAGELIRTVDEELGNENISFYSGTGYRHLMVWQDGIENVDCTPPHDITGKEIGKYLPNGNGKEVLLRLMKESLEVLRGHDINKRRIKSGRNPGNCIWLWGQGKKPSMPPFRDRYGLSGALISAVDLTKGLGVYAGFKIINVPGATGYIDTNYSGKSDAALESLGDGDFVYLHIEAPDEAGHNGNVEDKIRAIEDIDSRVIGPLLRKVEERFGRFRVLIMPDHATPISLRTHTDDFVPFIIYDSGKSGQSGFDGYNEIICGAENVITFEKAHKLMDFFIYGQQ
ncbi:cofactor-independent phosphoglycerate mutase [bacterium BMS3Abin07]|nr:cofactor-independent phosphoglycerate mutase [bacterium BMS3Abin07]GBE33268.1 cofactor-independent phosphoglycerate mutase [bacterium BMS3Bbin05]HDL19804.1 cofactor-independent phosphoglycerate mutase [Nitrospirota bacterium]HDO23101.1 cofactor-independent phosphoglycerate mutase [Nitrospirota bacterium]